MEKHLSGGGLLLLALKKAGVDYFFINSGTEYAALLIDYQQMKRSDRPEMVVSLHESTAVSAACGYGLKSDKPCAVLVHTVPGVTNSLSNLLNAFSARIPLILVSGVTPFSNQGYAGSKNIRVHWGQDVRNIQEIVRQFVKWDYLIKSVDEIPSAVARALEISIMSPEGPVYIGIYREWLMMKAGEQFKAPKPTPVSKPAPDPSSVKQVVEKLLEAEYPVVLTRSAGRWVENVELLVRLAELVGCRVSLPVGDYVNFPTTNPFSAQFKLSDADFILAVENDVPWIPSGESPRDDAYKIYVSTDPLMTNYGVWGFSFDKAIQSHSKLFLEAVVKELEKSKQYLKKDVVEERRAKAFEDWTSEKKARDREVESDFRYGILTKRLASHILGQVVSKNTVIVNEYSLRPEYLVFESAGTYFGEPPAGALGWGLGAALGIKLAEPDRDVVVVVGDGSYVFNNPVSAHCMSLWYSLPILVVILNDGRWGDVKRSILDSGLYSSFEDVNKLEGVDFPMAIDFYGLAQGLGLEGYNVDEVSMLKGVLSKAFATVKSGKPAVVDVKISSRASLV
ncbi:MAG: thiamine pyrophosphate-requiring protein [Candidatus Caldarchaeum sp.]